MVEWDKDKIRAFRKKKLGLTQHQFASLLGTSSALIRYWEKGERNPGPMSRKFLSLIAGVADIEREIEEIKSREQKENEISGEEILALREKLGLSQTEFASRLGRAVSCVSRWESGERSPGKKSIRRIKKLASSEGIELPLSSEAQAGKIPESDN